MFKYNRLVATLRPLRYFAPKYKGPSSMDNRERGSHARGVYPTQDTSALETVRVKREEEADTRIIEKGVVRNLDGRNVGTIYKGGNVLNKA